MTVTTQAPGAVVDMARAVLLARMASIVLLLLVEWSHFQVLHVLVLAVAAVETYALMRGLRSVQGVGYRQWFAPAVDGCLTAGILLAFGTQSVALVHVATTLFVWALIGTPRGRTLVFAPVGATFVLAFLASLDNLQVVSSMALAGYAAMLVACIVAALRLLDLMNSRVEMERTNSAVSLLRAQSEERVRLSVEMHDSVAKSLHGIHLMAAALERSLTQSGHAAAKDVSVITRSVHQARQEARALVRDFRQPDLPDFEAALMSAVAAWQERCPDVELTTEVGQADFGPGVAREVLRTIEELLENIFRHSRARRAVLTIRSVDGWVEVEVSDDGVGMDTSDEARSALAEAGHYGLGGVTHRAQRIRADLDFGEGLDGRGLRVRLRVPERLPVDARPELADPELADPWATANSRSEVTA